jgi:hypothetical protein
VASQVPRKPSDEKLEDKKEAIAVIKKYHRVLMPLQANILKEIQEFPQDKSLVPQWSYTNLLFVYPEWVIW